MTSLPPVFTNRCCKLVSDQLSILPGQFQVNFVAPQLAAGEYLITVSIGGKTSQANVLFEFE